MKYNEYFTMTDITRAHGAISFLDVWVTSHNTYFQKKVNKQVQITRVGKVVHSRDHEGVGMVHEMASPKILS